MYRFNKFYGWTLALITTQITSISAVRDDQADDLSYAYFRCHDIAPDMTRFKIRDKIGLQNRDTCFNQLYEKYKAEFPARVEKLAAIAAERKKARLANPIDLNNIKERGYPPSSTSLEKMEWERFQNYSYAERRAALKAANAALLTGADQVHLDQMRALTQVLTDFSYLSAAEKADFMYDGLFSTDGDSHLDYALKHALARIEAAKLKQQAAAASQTAQPEGVKA